MCILFQHHLLKRLSFLLLIAFSPLSEITWLYLCGSISGFSVLFYWSVCSFSSVPVPFCLHCWDTELMSVFFCGFWKVFWYCFLYELFTDLIWPLLCNLGVGNLKPLDMHTHLWLMYLFCCYGALALLPFKTKTINRSRFKKKYVQLVRVLHGESKQAKYANQTTVLCLLSQLKLIISKSRPHC